MFLRMPTQLQNDKEMETTTTVVYFFNYLRETILCFSSQFGNTSFAQKPFDRPTFDRHNHKETYRPDSLQPNDEDLVLSAKCFSTKSCGTNSCIFFTLNCIYLTNSLTVPERWDSNPWPWNDEVCVLPMCCHFCPTKYNFVQNTFWFLNGFVLTEMTFHYKSQT